MLVRRLASFHLYRYGQITVSKTCRSETNHFERFKGQELKMSFETLMNLDLTMN